VISLQYSCLNWNTCVSLIIDVVSTLGVLTIRTNAETSIRNGSVTVQSVKERFRRCFKSHGSLVFDLLFVIFDTPKQRLVGGHATSFNSLTLPAVVNEVNVVKVTGMIEAPGLCILVVLWRVLFTELFWRKMRIVDLAGSYTRA
jgi:hypothetical protein